MIFLSLLDLLGEDEALAISDLKVFIRNNFLYMLSCLCTEGRAFSADIDILSSPLVGEELKSSLLLIFGGKIPFRIELSSPMSITGNRFDYLIFIFFSIDFQLLVRARETCLFSGGDYDFLICSDLNSRKGFASASYIQGSIVYTCSRLPSFFLCGILASSNSN